MDRNIFYTNNITDSFEKYKNQETQENVDFTICKDSLENSLNLANCISLNDSLNCISNNETKTICVEEIEECSIEEKNKFSNNLKELKKSFFIKSTQSNINFNASNTTSCVNSKNDCEETAKISYKFVSKCEIAEAQKKLNELNIKQMKEKSNVTVEKYFWFGAYDKLMKTKNLKKIFSFYADDMELENSSFPIKLLANNIKEQPIILKDFEIYFDNTTENFTFPFIRAKKDGIAFLKLYYISIKNFNKIYNYINKTDQVIQEKDFLFANNLGDQYSLIQKKPMEAVNNFKFSSLMSNRNAVTYPYSELLCLGSFINTNIYTFTNYHALIKQSTPSIKFNLPKNEPKPNQSNGFIKTKTKIIVKMIKYLTSTFPNYSAEFFVYHIFFRSGLNSDLTNGLKENNFLKINLSDIKNQINKKNFKNLDSISAAVGKKKSPVASGKNNLNQQNNIKSKNSNINIGNINVTTQNNLRINKLNKETKNHHSMTNIVDSYYEGKISMNNSKINVLNKCNNFTMNTNFDEKNKKDTTEYLSTNISNLNMYSNDNMQENYTAILGNNSQKTPKKPISGRNKLTTTLMNKIAYSNSSMYGNNIKSNVDKNYNSSNKILSSSSYNKLKLANNESGPPNFNPNNKIKSVSKPNICFTEFNFITNPLYLNEISIEEIEDNVFNNKIGNLPESFNHNEKKMSNNPSTNIFVVARDDKIRFRTDYDADSIDTIEDYEGNSQMNVPNKMGNPNINVNPGDGDKACFNTPTKKKIFRYYS